MVDIQEIVKCSKKLTILYVEDNEEARVSTISFFDSFFDNIVVAKDGKEGLEAFRQNSIDIIITDINMPVLNGLDMIREIRAFNKEIPILILSAYNESDFFLDSIKLGVDGYLLKPIDIQQFLDTLTKVTDKLRLKESSLKSLTLLNQYQEITDRSSIVSKTDEFGNITYVNQKFCDTFGYTKSELIGKNHNIIRHSESKDDLFKELWGVIKDDKKIWQGVMKNLSKDGKSHYQKSTIKPILDHNGNIIEYIALRDDITDIMNPKKQLNDLMDSLDETLIILIQIERFSDIESFYGQKIVNKIEDTFSQNLLKFMPNDITFEKVFMLGGGLYALAKNRADCIIELEPFIAHLKEFQHTINDYTINVNEIDYDISVIISLAYGDNSLENAKYGLKELKRTQQDFIVANDISAQEQDKARKNLETIKMVKKAIEEFNIVSYFQPIIDNKTKKVQKYESLVRLINSNKEVISPFFFLDVAKKGKYYSQITSMVLENSFNALKYTDMDISINISVLDIEKKSTRDEIFKLLDTYKEHSSRVVFELLEDENIKDIDLIKAFISTIKDKGVSIAIDDFGAGYSNFERLLIYQPDILKIDGSLIKNIEKSKFSLSVVKSIVTFTKEQNIKTIAEYVENENIYNILNSLGIDYSQGYYFGKPQIL